MITLAVTCGSLLDTLQATTDRKSVQEREYGVSASSEICNVVNHKPHTLVDMLQQIPTIGKVDTRILHTVCMLQQNTTIDEFDVSWSAYC